MLFCVTEAECYQLLDALDSLVESREQEIRCLTSRDLQLQEELEQAVESALSLYERICDQLVKA